MHSVMDDGYSPLGEQFARVLSAARAGGEWAWSELYRAVAPDLLRYLRARAVPDADDVVGETFLRVVRGISSFAGDGGAFRAWIFTIGRNLAIDASRRRARRPEDLRDDLGGSLGPVGDAEAEALRELTREHVARVLGELTEDQRDVLLLRFLSDLSFAEIATIMDKREGAVRMIQNRGLQALRGRISDGRVTL
jgi:RNA polymerase sigma-70 factor (ECF subfamily)